MVSECFGSCEVHCGGPGSIEMASTADLIDELRNRFVEVACITAKPHPYEKDSTVYETVCKGSTHALIGLWELFKAKELHNYITDSRSVSEDEDV